MTREPAVRSPLSWLRRGRIAIHLLVRFLVALAVANLQQARIVLGRPREVRPRWIRFETRLRSDTARTVLGVLISLTPWTLTCDLEDATLLVHVLDVQAGDDVEAQIRERFESLLLRLEES
jgi:multicomponent K+:H+ antiporter subunit E